MRITEKMWDRYNNQYPNDFIGFHDPSGEVFIENAAGDAFAMPEDETEQKFLDRLKRSEAAGRNLFYEEWPTDVDEVPEDAQE